MDTFDYVIVGAGSAGCVLTNRLSEDASTSVCVLEAGRRIGIPTSICLRVLSRLSHAQHQLGLSAGARSWTAAAASMRRVAKRSALVLDQRSHLQSRPASGFRHLGAARQSRLGLSDVLPYFKRLERRIGEGEDTYRGREGNLTVTTWTGGIRSAKPSWRVR